MRTLLPLMCRGLQSSASRRSLTPSLIRHRPTPTDHLNSTPQAPTFPRPVHPLDHPHSVTRIQSNLNTRHTTSSHPRIKPTTMLLSAPAYPRSSPAQPRPVASPSLAKRQPSPRLHASTRRPCAWCRNQWRSEEHRRPTPLFLLPGLPTARRTPRPRRLHPRAVAARTRTSAKLRRRRRPPTSAAAVVPRTNAPSRRRGASRPWTRSAPRCSPGSSAPALSCWSARSASRPATSSARRPGAPRCWVSARTARPRGAGAVVRL